MKSVTGGSTVSPLLPAGDEWVAVQDTRESNARTYARRLRLSIHRAEGIFVYDAHGRQYFDCLAAAGTLALGHAHPAVKAAAHAFIDQNLPFQTLDITTPVKHQFTEAIFASLPESFARRARIQFCGPTGADAIEAALKLVRTATRRPSIAAFSGGYHGMTQGALALTGNLSPKRVFSPTGGGTQFFPYPYDFRCPFGLGGEAGEKASAALLQAALSDPESGFLTAGLVLEAVQGEGGVIPAPIEWLKRVRQITQAHDVPMIVDEVQTGWGRTGKLYAFEHADIVPDVLVLSKAIGGGLPLSVIVYDQNLDVWEPGAHAGTFRGNQMAMATGLATLKVIQEENLADHAAQMGARLLAHLQNIQSELPCLGNIRGRGLMIGVEFIDPSCGKDALGHAAAHPALARRVQQECLARGLIIEMGGRHSAVARFLTPLIVTGEQIDAIADIFRQACHAANEALQ